MRALAREARGALQVYLVGGSTAVLEGWRESTIDVDLAFGESDDAVLRALPALKEGTRHCATVARARYRVRRSTCALSRP